MTYKIKLIFPDGVTQEQLFVAQRPLGISPDNLPEGLTGHEKDNEDGCIVYIEEWTSKELFETFFNQQVIPAYTKEDIPLPRIEEQ